MGLAADQLSKIAALANLQPGDPVDILGPVLRLTLIFNPGAAFGMGESATVVFAVFAIVATIAALWFMTKISKPWHGVALGLLLAGITGNLYDRIFQPPYALHGHVVDFIQVPYFAIFNVADICITCAAGLIILGSFLWEDDRKEAPEELVSA